MNDDTGTVTQVVVEGCLNNVAPKINGCPVTSSDHQTSIGIWESNVSDHAIRRDAEVAKEGQKLYGISGNVGESKDTSASGSQVYISDIYDYNCKPNVIKRPLLDPTCETYSETSEYCDDESLNNNIETNYSPAGYPRMRLALFSVLPVFMAYSSLITLEENLKHRLGIYNNKSARSYEFGTGASLLFLGNLIFRLLHNVFFSFLRPRERVYISYIGLAVPCGIIAIFYYVFNFQSLVFMYIAYIIGGVGIGTFESNIMSVITPLGPETKVWAQYGMPVGFAVVSVGTYSLLVFLPNNVPLLISVYSVIAISNIMGLLFFKFYIPDIHFGASEQGFRDLLNDLKEFREWIPSISLYALIFLLNMFCVSVGTALQQFIYDSHALPLVSHSHFTIPKNIHRVLVNVMSLFGNVAGRKIAYLVKKKIHPLWSLIIVLSGASLLLSKQAILAPIGMFLVMLSNGLIYSSTTKHIDVAVNPKYNLVALSVWLFIGDAGSFIGANVVNPLLVVFGSV